MICLPNDLLLCTHCYNALFAIVGIIRVAIIKKWSIFFRLGIQSSSASSASIPLLVPSNVRARALVDALLAHLLTTGVCAGAPASSDVSCTVECGSLTRFLLLRVLVEDSASRDRFLPPTTSDVGIAVAVSTGLAFPSSPVTSLLGCTRSSPTADDSSTFNSSSLSSSFTDAEAVVSLFSLSWRSTYFSKDPITSTTVWTWVIKDVALLGKLIVNIAWLEDSLLWKHLQSNDLRAAAASIAQEWLDSSFWNKIFNVPGDRNEYIPECRMSKIDSWYQLHFTTSILEHTCGEDQLRSLKTSQAPCVQWRRWRRDSARCKISKGLKTPTHQRAQSSCEASIEESYTDEFRVPQ